MLCESNSDLQAPREFTRCLARDLLTAILHQNAVHATHILHLRRHQEYSDRIEVDRPVSALRRDSPVSSRTYQLPGTPFRWT